MNVDRDRQRQQEREPDHAPAGESDGSAGRACARQQEGDRASDDQDGRHHGDAELELLTRDRPTHVHHDGGGERLGRRPEQGSRRQPQCREQAVGAGQRIAAARKRRQERDRGRELGGGERQRDHPGRGEPRPETTRLRVAPADREEKAEASRRDHRRCDAVDVRRLEHVGERRSRRSWHRERRASRRAWRSIGSGFANRYAIRGANMKE